jgi:enoyl-CoA hydratase/carnithine racemase
MEMIFLPDRFDAETTHHLGRVNCIVPAKKLTAETMRIVRGLAAGQTRAYAKAKRLVNQSLSTNCKHLPIALEVPILKRE